MTTVSQPGRTAIRSNSVREVVSASTATPTSSASAREKITTAARRRPATQCASPGTTGGRPGEGHRADRRTAGGPARRMRMHRCDPTLSRAGGPNQRTRPSRAIGIGQDESVSRASLDKRPRDVAAMFDGVARRYDLTNTVLSGGRDRGWRKATGPRSRSDPATRCSTWRPAPRSPRYSSDLAVPPPSRATSPSGCSSPAKPHGTRTYRWWPGTRWRCRSRTPSFDAVTIAFGLRNVADMDAALRELARVTKPGGRLVVCEFGRPTWAPWRTVYTEYLMRALPAVARRCPATRRRTSTSPSRSGPGRTSSRLARRIEAAGWQACSWRDLTGGIVALHRAVRPGRPDQETG